MAPDPTSGPVPVPVRWKCSGPAPHASRAHASCPAELAVEPPRPSPRLRPEPSPRSQPRQMGSGVLAAAATQDRPSAGRQRPRPPAARFWMGSAPVRSRTRASSIGWDRKQTAEVKVSLPWVTLGRGWATRQRGEGGPRDGTCPLRSSQLRLLCERLSQPKLELRQRVLQPLQVGLRLLPRRRLLCQFEARRALLHVRRPPLRW